MRRRHIARPLALAAAAALGMSSPAVSGGPAEASLPGTNVGLTSANGTTQIQFDSGSALNAAEAVKQLAWSPDGSRAVYVNNTNEIKTMRADGSGITPVTVTGEGTQPERGSPSWMGLGTRVLFAEKSGINGTWRIMTAPTGFGTPKALTSDDGSDYTNPDGGPDGMLAFQKQPVGGTPEVIVGRLTASGLQKQLFLSDAKNPAISPDGKRVAFIRGNDLLACAIANCSATTIALTTAFFDGGVDHPAWSPDGLSVAVQSLVVNKIFKAMSSEPGKVDTGLTGIPAYQPSKINLVTRLFGANRFETAIATSQSIWGSTDGRLEARSVVLSRSDLFADALGGSALAAVKQGPLLLTQPISLHPGTKQEIQRVLGGRAGTTVYLLGGTGAISQTVEDEITSMGFQVTRLSGADRFQTAIAIADAINPVPSKILVATGRNFPDALAAGAAAGAGDSGNLSLPAPGSAVVVLSNDTTVPATVAAYLQAKSGAATVYGIGGQGSAAAAGLLGADKVIRVAGSDRYETARLTARTFFGVEDVAGIATGSNWPDALAGGALMGTLRGPLLLTPSNSDSLSESTRSGLDAKSGAVEEAVIFGGPGTVNTAIEGKAGVVISGPAGFQVRVNPANILVS